MAYEYAISAGPGTLMDYGTVETLDEAKWPYFDAEDAMWGDYGIQMDLSIIIMWTPDAHDCETGR